MVEESKEDLEKRVTEIHIISIGAYGTSSCGNCDYTLKKDDSYDQCPRCDYIFEGSINITPKGGSDYT